MRDDVLQVAREAFRNAVLHAKAHVVQVDLSWGDERFILRVRDDGVGLDPKLLAQGRDGHWGLQGMRERTRQVGGSLEIRSEENSGTVVELSVPAAARIPGRSRRALDYFRRFAQGGKDSAGERQCHCVRAVVGAEFGGDALHVRLDGFLGDREPCADFLV